MMEIPVTYMYSEHTDAHLIDYFIILSVIYRSYKCQRQHVILRELQFGTC
jgi:hypothetical protein